MNELQEGAAAPREIEPLNPDWLHLKENFSYYLNGGQSSMCSFTPFGGHTLSNLILLLSTGVRAPPSLPTSRLHLHIFAPKFSFSSEFHSFSLMFYFARGDRNMHNPNHDSQPLVYLLLFHFLFIFLIYFQFFFLIFLFSFFYIIIHLHPAKMDSRVMKFCQYINTYEF